MTELEWKATPHSNSYPDPIENLDEARQGLRRVEGNVQEMHRWFDRIDAAVDDIAKHFGVEAPYSLQGRDWRYNPAARLEHLTSALKAVRR